MASSLTHIALHVRDLEACVAFYRTYCDMRVTRDRPTDEAGNHVVWMAKPGQEHAFVFVLIPGGPGRDQSSADFSHFGFALESREAVDAIAERGRKAGCLAWEPRREPYPVGYYCGLRDPDGNIVEFSYGQPLGPGAEDEEHP